MITLGAGLILFGIIVLAYPQLIAYLIAFFFIAIGINMLVFGMRIQRGQNAKNGQNGFRFGSYEIIRRNK